MAPPLGRGRAADKRVTNHDGWEFNGVPTLHTELDGTNYMADHLVAEDKNQLFLGYLFDTCFEGNPPL